MTTKNKLSQLLAATTEMPVTVGGITINCEVYLNALSYEEALEMKKKSAKQQAQSALNSLMSADGKTEVEKVKNAIKYAKELIESVDADFDDAAKSNYEFVMRTCKSWDLDDDENVLPINAETLGKLPTDFFEAYATEYTDRKKSLTGNSPKTQSSSQAAENSQVE